MGKLDYDESMNLHYHAMNYRGASAELIQQIAANIEKRNELFIRLKKAKEKEGKCINQNK